jgi:hypothetical protein
VLACWCLWVRTKGYDLARYSCSTIVDMNFGVRMLRALGLCARRKIMRTLKDAK